MTASVSPPLSVLDLVLRGPGASAGAALRDATAVARAADELGFRRFWVAEFHDSPLTANASPPVLLAHVAAATSRIRVGSGAMLVPYHRPLLLAEQFGTLAALHPGRVDLGLGRGAGTGRATAELLRAEGSAPTPHATRVRQVVDHLAGRPDPDGKVVRVPGDPDGTPVPVFVLGSRADSARLAGEHALPYVFGHHLAPGRGEEAVDAYREAFVPTPGSPRPHTIVCVQTICGETDAHARLLSLPVVAAAVRSARGEPATVPTLAEAATLAWSAEDEAAMATMARVQAIGSPDTVAARLAEIVERLRPDEIMVTASVPDAGERIRGLERLRSVLSADVSAGPGGVSAPSHDGDVGAGTGAGPVHEQGETHVHAPA